ncbi:MAG TPA: DUF1326 domain-containing protein [Candidatus Acidoferrales bacterium]|jgi:hypothetical protein|nr:DUF1326 domain-containing protein [Candidatus Acidoferrales bacterium]
MRGAISLAIPSLPRNHHDQMPSTWKIQGDVVIACNCDYGCPCNFNALPSHGFCEGVWNWLVREGKYGDVPLDGVNFSLFVKWPGAIHEGNGEAVLMIDERASVSQQQAISTLIKGGEGGPWGILAWTWPKLHGPKLVRYTIQQNGIQSRVSAGDCFELVSTAIKNPVSGAEVHPGIVLPEGLIVKKADLGSSQVFRLDAEISMNHPGRYTAIGPFEYSGPPENTKH